jgi:hypothetical protein
MPQNRMMDDALLVKLDIVHTYIIYIQPLAGRRCGGHVEFSSTQVCPKQDYSCGGATRFCRTTKRHNSGTVCRRRLGLITGCLGQFQLL